MTQDESTPKIQIDSDWKAEAQAEKERLAAAEDARSEKAGGPAGAGSRELPEASFQSLVAVLASQAMMGLGGVQDPETNRIVVDLEGARFAIDLLDVMEEKTRGNLSDEESTELKQLTTELRSRFVQFTQIIAQQAAGGGPGADPAAGQPGPIIQ